MKKFLIFALFLTSTPIFASCLIDGSSTACSLSERRKELKTTFSTKPSIEEFSDMPDVRLTPMKNENETRILREFGPKTSDYSYNSSCQFGVCYDSGAPTKFYQPQRR